MAYLVHTVEGVRAYLRAFAGLSREGRLKLLREHGDTFRSDGYRRTRE